MNLTAARLVCYPWYTGCLHRLDFTLNKHLEKYPKHPADGRKDPPTELPTSDIVRQLVLSSAAAGPLLM